MSIMQRASKAQDRTRGDRGKRIDKAMAILADGGWLSLDGLLARPIARQAQETQAVA